MQKNIQNILLVDDHPENLFLLETLLEESGRNFLKAESGKEALRILLNHDVALIILDVQMPGMDGFETAKLIRGTSQTKYIPIIFVTALSHDDVHIFKGYKSGAVDYMSKPFEPDILKSKVKFFLEMDSLIRDASLETIYRLSVAAEFRDNENTSHLERMSEYTKIIAKTMGFQHGFVEMIKLASPMHDIGKIGVPDKILFKPSEYTTAEYTEMKRHPEIGHLILKDSNSRLLQMADRIAYTHHEKFDGSGYPRGIGGTEISIEGRIVAITDVYDALIEERIYKPAFSETKTLELIKARSGNHFDPLVFEAFMDSYDEIEQARYNINKESFNDKTDLCKIDLDSKII
jgi:putative two-component system response regulator